MPWRPKAVIPITSFSCSNTASGWPPSLLLATFNYSESYCKGGCSCFFSSYNSMLVKARWHTYQSRRYSLMVLFKNLTVVVLILYKSGNTSPGMITGWNSQALNFPDSQYFSVFCINSVSRFALSFKPFPKAFNWIVSHWRDVMVLDLKDKPVCLFVFSNDGASGFGRFEFHSWPSMSFFQSRLNRSGLQIDFHCYYKVIRKDFVSTWDARQSLFLCLLFLHLLSC